MACAAFPDVVSVVLFDKMRHGTAIGSQPYWHNIALSTVVDLAEIQAGGMVVTFAVDGLVALP